MLKMLSVRVCAGYLDCETGTVVIFKLESLLVLLPHLRVENRNKRQNPRFLRAGVRIACSLWANKDLASQL